MLILFDVRVFPTHVHILYRKLCGAIMSVWCLHYAGVCSQRVLRQPQGARSASVRRTQLRDDVAVVLSGALRSALQSLD